MNVIKITDERIDAILPKSIKDSDVLNNNDKKVLGAILHYFLILDKAKENKYVILTNEDLRKTVCIRKAYVLSSVHNLIEMKLIKRECGKSRTKGEKPQASKYYVNWSNLKKPLKKLEFEDLFSDFISSEKPSGTVDIDTDIDTDIDEDTVSVIDIDKEPVADVTEVIKEINKEKIKEKLSYQSSMDIKVSEPENKIISFKNMMKENEMSDNGTNVMNAISEQSERQAKENESSGCDKINEMTTSMATPNNINDTGTIPQETQVKNKESSSQPQVKNILPPATATLETDEDKCIENITNNIDFSMKAMYNGRYNINEWALQYEYFTLQCHNLNVLMGDDKYHLYKKQYITPWWNNTKQYFPDGYEKLMKKPTQWEIDKFKKFYNWMEHAQEEREVALAYQNICALLEHLNSKYGEKTLDTLTNQIIHEISSIKHRNNHVSNYIEKIQAS